MRDTKLILILLGVLVFFAVGFILHTLEPILLPFVVAVFLSQLFAPLNKALRRRGVPGALAILVVLVLVSLVILAFAGVVYSSAQSFSAGDSGPPGTPAPNSAACTISARLSA